MPSGIKPIRPLDAREGRRLAETVRELAADRERLLARIATLEQSIDGITGSIARVEKAAKAADARSRGGTAPAPSRPEEDVTSSVNRRPACRSCRCRRRRRSSVSKTEFGLDLGSATTVEALRTAWAAALRRHGTLLEGLRPVVQMRERPRAGGSRIAPDRRARSRTRRRRRGFAPP